MSRPAPQIRLSAEEKKTLLGWMRSSKTEQRRVDRARVILLAASRLATILLRFVSDRRSVQLNIYG